MASRPSESSYCLRHTAQGRPGPGLCFRSRREDSPVQPQISGGRAASWLQLTGARIPGNPKPCLPVRCAWALSQAASSLGLLSLPHAVTLGTSLGQKVPREGVCGAAF